MGSFNSAITRVLPVFGKLIGRDATGMSWVPELIGLCRNAITTDRLVPAKFSPLLPYAAKFERPLPRNLAQILGVKSAVDFRLRNCFEAEYGPPQLFLEWLIKNPDRMTWSVDKGKLRQYGSKTHQRRLGLFNNDEEIRKFARQEVSTKGSTNSRMKWWAFEGMTCVDACFESEDLLLFVEGKRTENLSAATDWFKQRNQLARNLEVAQVEASKTGKAYAVILCSETPVSLTAADLEGGYPHLSEGERAELYRHFLGNVTWAEIVEALCRGMILPETVSKAVELGLDAAIQPVLRQGSVHSGDFGN